jgi:hypothetical protein
MPTTEEDRSHFHAWAVVSSPLVLGYDLRNTSITERIWPIISNRRVVQINQRWAGHPGRLVKAWDVVPQPPAPPGSGYIVAGSCSTPGAASYWRAVHALPQARQPNVTREMTHRRRRRRRCRSDKVDIRPAKWPPSARGQVHGLADGCGRAAAA